MWRPIRKSCKSGLSFFVLFFFFFLLKRGNIWCIQQLFNISFCFMRKKMFIILFKDVLFFVFSSISSIVFMRWLWIFSCTCSIERSWQTLKYGASNEILMEWIWGRRCIAIFFSLESVINASDCFSALTDNGHLFLLNEQAQVAVSWVEIEVFFFSRGGVGGFCPGVFGEKWSVSKSWYLIIYDFDYLHNWTTNKENLQIAKLQNKNIKTGENVYQTPVIMN